MYVCTLSRSIANTNYKYHQGYIYILQRRNNESNGAHYSIDLQFQNFTKIQGDDIILEIRSAPTFCEMYSQEDDSFSLTDKWEYYIHACNYESVSSERIVVHWHQRFGGHGKFGSFRCLIYEAYEAIICSDLYHYMNHYNWKEAACKTYPIRWDKKWDSWVCQRTRRQLSYCVDISLRLAST